MARYVRCFKYPVHYGPSPSESAWRRIPIHQTSAGSTQKRLGARLLQSTAVEHPVEKKRVVFLGTPDVAATSLRSLYDESQKSDSCFSIVGVVTQPPKRRKRKGKLEQSPVGKVAEEIGLNLLFPEKVCQRRLLNLAALQLKMLLSDLTPSSDSFLGRPTIQIFSMTYRIT